MEHAVVALTTTVGVAFLFVIYFLWRRLRLDIFRDHLFRLRERWFDLALDPDSTLRFDSQLYRSVEQSLCGMLQFAHRVSFSFVVLVRIGERIGNIETDVEPIERITRNIKKIDDTYTRNKAVEIWTGIPVAILNHMVQTSIVFFLLTAVQFVLLLLRRRHTRAAKESVVKQHEPVLEKIETTAYRNLASETV